MAHHAATLENQSLQALAGQFHRRPAAGDAAAHHDRVVGVLAPGLGVEVGHPAPFTASGSAPDRRWTVP